MSDVPALVAARSRLARDAEALGYPAGAADALEALVRAVTEENERINLTGARDLATALAVLAIDALPVARAWDATARSPALVADLGSGNGFPGAAAAARWPDARVVLVERRGKKAEAIARCLRASGFERVEVLACDGREATRLRPDLAGRTDLVTVRAVGDLAPTTREVAGWLAPGGRVAHWKPGALDDAERAAGLLAARSVRLAALPDVEFEGGPGTAPRRLVLYERPARRARQGSGAKGSGA